MTDRLPEEMCERIFAGETPLRMWREFRALEVTDLRRKTGIGVGRLEKLEAGKGLRMSEEEERLLARALDIGRASLRPQNMAGCSALDVDDDEIIGRGD